jgi:D-glycero-D-manno-heptose 1,7-bisphosphate phosphatase
MRKSKSLVVLLDRDGIINRMRPDYVKRWEEVEIIPGSLDTLARLSRGGCELIVLTNQSAIGRGLVTRETVDKIHDRMASLIEGRGGKIRDFLVCPHTPADACACRKPAPGLLIRARDELGVDLSNAVMLGDQLSDVEAARAAGCRAILIDPAGHRARKPTDGWTLARSLSEAADLILQGR